MTLRGPCRVLVVTAVLAGGTLAVAVGCGDDAPNDPGADAAGGSSSGGSSNGTSGAGSSSGGSSGQSTSSGGIMPAPDDPQPGVVACGSSSCDVEAGSTCCLTAGGATCQSGGIRCDGGIRHLCDESKDCVNPSPTVCCLGTYGTGVTARCSTDECVGSNPQLCRSTAECDGSVCAFATCEIGGVSFVLRTCGGKC